MLKVSESEIVNRQLDGEVIKLCNAFKYFVKCDNCRSMDDLDNKWGKVNELLNK